ncbi:hypothetical protein CXB51_005646 [Gossypium anomalum]|uniref:C3H1-type domain-containing protein n=1 Tax=Gossypium anomalum TaxID=47600 RepID=A0A8J5ZI55_9ROSI|nr:hypothetical protein CXB51_005646 [Gossypium anomalum]
MSKSRKCSSKWDLKEERQYSLENVQDSAWFANACDRESEHGSFSLEFGRNGNNDCATNWKTTTPCDGDETYGMKKSPTLDDRRQQYCHHSLKSDRSRSQSVLTEAGVGAEVEVVVEAQFMALGGNRDSLRRPETDLECQLKYLKNLWLGDAGEAVNVIFLTKIFKAMRMGWDNRQKRASVSKYITRNKDKYYLIESGRSTDCCTNYRKANCRRGASCRSAHDGVSDGFSKGSINEISRERENNKRNKLTSPERDVEQLTNINTSFNVDKYGNASNRSDADVSNESEIPWTGPKWSAADASIDLYNSWVGSKQSDTSVYLGASKLNKDTNKFSNYNMDERWQHGYDACGKNSESSMHCKRIDIDKEDLKKIENIVVNTGVSEPKGAEEIHSSVDKEKSHSLEPTPVGTSLKNIIEKASGHAHHENIASQLMSKEESNFHLDHMIRGQEVDSEILNQLIGLMVYLSIENDTKDLYLFINGWVILGVAIYDTIQFMQPDVYTICMGL